MNKGQLILISVTTIVFAVLYLGFDIKPSKHKEIERQRANSFTETDINSLLVDAKSGLSPQALASVKVLEEELQESSADSIKLEAYRQLSSLWYQMENPGIAGYYAERLAELNPKDEEAWSIAGTTFSICLQREQEEKIRSFCTDHAVRSLEKAASLNPDNVQHRVNLALVYAENPPKDTPMKGILMLVELNKQNPDNVLVLTQLGRLAIKTSQFEKAAERLDRAMKLEPNNKNIACLLAQAYEGMGQSVKASEFRQKCEKLIGN